jgi:hemolysin activation/secretion protein
VDLAPGPFIDGSVDADNAGNRYTGENRLGGTVNFNELLGQGDTLTLRGMVSNDGLGYGRGAYQWQMGAARAGVSYAYMKYWLGEEFNELEAQGTANVTSAFGSYPLIRRRNKSLYVQAAYDFRRFRDEVRAASAVSRKDADVWLLNVNGDSTDSFGGGGHTRYSLTWTTGDLRILTADLQTIDAATARTEGQYVKAGLVLTRLQALGARTSAYFSFSGQVASRNLDISEKMELGGPNAVRAYPEGEAYGDEGFVTTLEGRWALSGDAMGRLPGTLSLVAFADYGEVTLSKDRWAPGDNHRSLSAAGLGVNWAEENDFIVRLSYAFKLGSEEATSAPDADGRFWAQLVKFF